MDADAEEEFDDEVLSRLIDLESKDRLTDEAVLAEAADPGSPLHGEFEWDDSTAAQEYRRSQAQRLIGRYRRVVVLPEGGIVTVRRFTYVPSLGRSVDSRAAVKDWRVEIEARAVRELRSWRLKYRMLGDERLREMEAE
jgi:hypothetical protein